MLAPVDPLEEPVVIDPRSLIIFGLIAFSGIIPVIIKGWLQVLGDAPLEPADCDGPAVAVAPVLLYTDTLKQADVLALLGRLAAIEKGLPRPAKGGVSGFTIDVDPNEVIRLANEGIKIPYDPAKRGYLRKTDFETVVRKARYDPKAAGLEKLRAGLGGVAVPKVPSSLACNAAFDAIAAGNGVVALTTAIDTVGEWRDASDPYGTWQTALLKGRSFTAVGWALFVTVQTAGFSLFIGKPVLQLLGVL